MAIGCGGAEEDVEDPAYPMLAASKLKVLGESAYRKTFTVERTFDGIMSQDLNRLTSRHLPDQETVVFGHSWTNAVCFAILTDGGPICCVDPEHPAAGFWLVLTKMQRGDTIRVKGSVGLANRGYAVPFLITEIVKPKPKPVIHTF